MDGGISVKRSLFGFLVQYSLVRQLTIIFSGIVIVPTILASIFLLMNSRSLILKESDFQSVQILSQVENSIENNRVLANNVATQIFYQQELQYYLNDTIDISDVKMDYFESLLRTEKANVRNVYKNKFYQMVIYSIAREFPQPFIGILYNSDSIETKPYYQEVVTLADHEYWGEVRPVEPMLEYLGSKVTVSPVTTTTFVMPYYRKIYEPVTNRVLGFLELDIQVEKMLDVASVDLGSDQIFYVFNRSGELIYISDPSLANMVSPTNPDQQNKLVSDHDIAGAVYRVNYKYSDASGLTLCSAIRRDNIDRQIFNRYLMFIVLFLLVSGLVILLIFMMSRLLLKRLHTLDLAIANVERGDFNIQLSETGSDEVTRISRSFNRMTSKLNEMIHRVVKEETARQDAEIHALMAQINPHFLFNTLENIRMECEIQEQYELSDTLASLGELLRYSIDWKSPMTNLAAEIANLENYIRIMKMRFRNKVIYTEEIDQTTLDFLVPKMILQPIVENAYNHGFKNQDAPWRLELKIVAVANGIEIRVFNSGKVISDDRLIYLQDCLIRGSDIIGSRGAASSIGLTNVNRRIRMQYGPGSGVFIESLPNVGTTVSILIFAKDNEVRNHE